MWFWPVIVAVVIIAIGGVLAGGVFTVILIPLAGFALVLAAVYGVWARALEQRTETENQRAHDSSTAFARHPNRPSGRAATSPEGLADARRQQQ